MLRRHSSIFLERRPIVRIALGAATCILLLVDAAGADPPRYRFTPIPGIVAIANNGTILLEDGICRDGVCEPISVDLYTPPYAHDINSSGDVVGTAVWGGAQCVSSSGFLRDRDGTVTFAVSGLGAISDSGVILGHQSFCIAFAPVVLVDGETLYLWEWRPQLLHAFPHAINASSVVLASYSNQENDLVYVLSDGRDLVFLDPMDLPGVAAVRYANLNNRGQVVGWWEERPTTDAGHVPRYQGFLRETDGTVLRIDLDHDWPATTIASAWVLGQIEEVTLHLRETLGAQLHDVNDRGDVVATVIALYEGQASDGRTISQLERVGGLASPR
jgi:hypothetical protein